MSGRLMISPVMVSLCTALDDFHRSAAATCPEREAGRREAVRMAANERRAERMMDDAEEELKVQGRRQEVYCCIHGWSDARMSHRPMVRPVNAVRVIRADRSMVVRHSMVRCIESRYNAVRAWPCRLACSYAVSPFIGRDSPRRNTDLYWSVMHFV